MPQVDVEVLVTACEGGGNDRKIVCETLVDGGFNGYPPKNDNSDDSTDAPQDFPPESFWLSKDAEYDWYDRYAFYERKESTKGNSNSANLNSNIHPGSNSNSQRFSAILKSKASIIGLPKTQKTTYVDFRRKYCKPANMRLFPKRPESVGRTMISTVEPSSPKVSCMGRVRSKRCRRRSNSLKKKEKPIEKQRIGDGKQKQGFYSMIISMFRPRKNPKKPVRSRSGRVEEEPTVVGPIRKSFRVCEIPISVERVAEPPGLGEMMRFASGRRSQSWSAENVYQGQGS
ncbi:uncharacterized protein LOC111403105 [Olea europaea var. sylvestris]|uniref:Uncharacterized protein n=1 Tax=Olea europaea subsp. europaea TaxID=158383 RepID=A0A8S0PYK6_OLEEU|nr:uncharacterized protein LOC111403105 [Olea europaea var. sylvestris]CAA2957726.1 Hypothetical predicted protein [Olea europaea subsp. europaea]